MENINPTQPSIISPAREIKVADDFYTHEFKDIQRGIDIVSIPADIHYEQNKN